MVDSRFPAEAETMLRDVERGGNPWGKPQTERASWAEEAGRAGAAAGRPAAGGPVLGRLRGLVRRAGARVSAVSTAKLLLAAGIDVAILGPRESCTGDPARRMGNEYVFQSFAQENVDDAQRGRRDEDRGQLPALLQHARARVPGLRRPLRGACTTRSSWPSSCATDGWRPRPARRTITYHDSCYLARHNDVLSAPREIVSRIGKPLEMARSGKRTFCCGAGGAHLWMEERGAQINEERAREAAATGADTLAVACPFCTVMLDDGVRQTGGTMRVADVSTLLAEALDDRRRRRARPFGHNRCVTVYLAGLAFFAVAGVLVYLALSLWAAREDGRDQRERDARRPPGR